MRKKFIHLAKVTKEYKEEERQKERKLATKLVRESSARGVKPEVGWSICIFSNFFTLNNII